MKNLLFSVKRNLKKAPKIYVLSPDKKTTYGSFSASSPEDFDNWDELYAQLVEDGYQTILALYLYDHSGISMSASSFLGRAQQAEWDSGQVGFIASKELGHDTYLMNEVSAYDNYLTGNVYAYRIYEDKSCESCNHTSQEVYEYMCGYDTIDEALRAGISEANYVKVGA